MPVAAAHAGRFHAHKQLPRPGYRAVCILDPHFTDSSEPRRLHLSLPISKLKLSGGRRPRQNGGNLPR